MDNKNNNPDKTAAALPKRFYDTVSCEHSDDGYQILLDGRVVKTPGKNTLSVHSKHIAHRLTSEWEAQDKVINPAIMPLTKIMNTSIDRVPAHKDEIIRELTSYANSDQICYRASEPSSLVELQQKNWDPLLAWLEETFAIRLEITQGIIHKSQDKRTLQQLSEYLSMKPAAFMAAFHALTTLSGSFVIAMALAEGEISTDQAWAYAHLDVDWQAERWGVDEEAQKARNNAFLEFEAAGFIVNNI